MGPDDPTKSSKFQSKSTIIQNWQYIFFSLEKHASTEKAPKKSNWVFKAKRGLFDW